LSEESHAGSTFCETPQVRFVGTSAGDPELCIQTGIEQWDHVLKPLDVLESADEEEDRGTLSTGFGFAGVDRGRIAVREEVLQDNHVPVESELAVLVGCELAGSGEDVDLLTLSLKKLSGTPELRRPTIAYSTANTLTSRADLTLVAPQDVSRANQPVLMSRVQLDPPTVGQDPGTTYQGHVVEVNDVETTFEDASYAPTVCDGPSGLLGGQRGQDGEPTSKRMDGHSGRLRRRLWLGPIAESAICVHVVDHIDGVAAASEGVGEGANHARVTTKVIGGVECGDHGEAEWLRGIRHHRGPPRTYPTNSPTLHPI